ncbi:MAG: HEAT repeat domain-containing protein, partial [Calditrichota bacterium]
EYGQGFASTFGAAALVDGGGNDVYRAGGLETHAPLRPEDYRSFAQGFAIGVRPRSGGGIAILHDLGGNDFYNAEIYAQGVGYWYSLGGLIDDGGNDVYNATQYVQGAGIHLAAGVLEDRGGDDRYGSRFGPGQGAGHDLSVGVLFDHSGDDQYTISGGQGMAITNSAALFVDLAGNDTYSTTEPQIGQGGAREARDFGSLSVFVDAEGNDSYSSVDEADSTAWLHGMFGVGYDVSRDSVKPREAEISVELVPSDTLKPIKDLFKEASEWEVTDNRERVRRARLALIAKGQEAVRWVGENKMNTESALERRAIVELFKAFPDSAAPYLYRALDTDNRYARRNAISVFGELKYHPALPALFAKLPDNSFEKLRPSILSVAGEIGDTSAVGTLLQYVSSPVERERIAAVVSLGKLNSPRGYETIVERLKDERYTVQSAAVIAAGKQTAGILPVLQKAMSSAPPHDLQIQLRAVERLAQNWKGNDETKGNLKKLQPIVRLHLEYPNPRVQAAALSAAATAFDDRELQKLIVKFNSTSDPVLGALVRRINTQLK